MLSLICNGNLIYSFSRLINTVIFNLLQINLSNLERKELYNKRTHKTSNCLLSHKPLKKQFLKHRVGEKAKELRKT